MGSTDMRRTSVFIFCILLSVSAGASDSSWIFTRSLSTSPHGHLRFGSHNFDNSLNIDRFEVRRGDCSSEPYWSDCLRFRERSELRSAEYDADGSSYLYRWDIFIPSGTSDLYPAKTVLGQFHQRRSRPSYLFVFRDGSYWLHRNILPRQPPVKLFDRDSLGKWNRVQVRANWAKENGYFEVSINDSIIYHFTGPTSTGDGVFFKYGIYRSNLDRLLPASFELIDRPQVVYYRSVERCIYFPNEGSCSRSSLPPTEYLSNFLRLQYINAVSPNALEAPNNGE